MKRNRLFASFILIFLISIIFVTPVFAIPKSTEALKGTPTIDGEVDDLWSQAHEIDVKTQSFTFTKNASPCTAKVKTLWDENYLYSLAIVQDPVISDKGIKPWDRDSIEFLIDQSNNKKEKGHHYDEHGGHYRVEAVSGEITGRYAAYEEAVQAGTLKAKAVLIEGGYRVEIAMPWTTLKGKTEAGTVIGYQVAINDDSGVGTRDGIIQWNSEDAWSVAHTEKIGNLVLSGEEAASKTYYISPDGDDANPGTLEAPWGTLSGNASRVKAGDTVYIRGGTYTGQTLSVESSGTKDNYITYAAYPGEKPVILDSTAYGVKIRKKEYVIIDGLEIRGTKGAWIEINRSSNIIVRNCHLTEGKLRTNGFFIYKSSYIMVQDSQIDTLLNQSIQDMDLIRCEESHHNIFERLTMTKGPHSCINLWNTSYTIVRDCTLQNVWQKNLDMIANQDGVEGRNVIENNRIYGSRHAIAEGFEWKGGLGIQIAVKDNIIRNNLIYDNDFYGVILNAWSGDEVSPTGASGNHIYNNVIAGNGSVKNPTASQSGMVMSDWGSGRDIGRNILLNNIFYDNREKVFFVKPSLGNNRIENNCIFGSDGKELVFHTADKGVQPVTWFESNVPGSVKGNRIADPLFVNAASGDYSLTEASPCVDAGRDLTVTTGEGAGTTLMVEDAGYFFDGYGITEGDEIVVGENPPVKIIGIDYPSNTITVASEIQWKKGDPVNLPFKGEAPDIGAVESEFRARVEDAKTPPVSTEEPGETPGSPAGDTGAAGSGNDKPKGRAGGFMAPGIASALILFAGIFFTVKRAKKKV